MEATWTDGDNTPALCPSCRSLADGSVNARRLEVARTRFVIGDRVMEICAICDALLRPPRLDAARLEVRTAY